MKGRWLTLIPALALVFALAGCDPNKAPTVTPTPTPAAGARVTTTPIPTYNAGTDGKVAGDTLIKDAQRGVHDASQNIADATR